MQNTAIKHANLVCFFYFVKKFVSAYKKYIIFIDKNNLPLCKFDLKVSSENSDYTGSISLGSLDKFDINGWYICCCIKTGKYKIISHKKAIEYAKYPGNLRQPSEKRKYKGQRIAPLPCIRINRKPSACPRPRRGCRCCCRKTPDHCQRQRRF